MSANKSFHLFALYVFAIILLGNTSLAASFKLSPSAQSVAFGCTEELTIMIDSEGKTTNAAEIEITYPPSLVSIIDADPQRSGTQIEEGLAYDSFIENTVLNTGKIHLTAASFSHPFNGNAVFATIRYKINSGSSSPIIFTISFTGIGNTMDSNIAEASTGRDILTSVQNSTITAAENNNCALDTIPPIIDFHTAGATILSANISDSQSGVDLNSIYIITNNLSLSLSDIGASVSGNSDNYLIDIPVDNIGLIVDLIAYDMVGNQSVKTYILPDSGCSSTDNTGFIDSCREAQKFLPEFLTNFLTQINFPIFDGVSSVGLFALLLDILLGSNHFYMLLQIIGGNSLKGGKLIAVLTNSLTKTPAFNISGIVRSGDINNKVHSDRFGYIFYKGKIGEKAELVLNQPYEYVQPLSSLKGKESVAFIDLASVPQKQRGIINRALSKLTNLQYDTILILSFISLILASLAFITYPSLFNLIMIFIGVIFVIWGFVGRILR